MYIEQGSQQTFRTGNVARDLIHGSEFPILVFMIAHIPLALLMRQAAAVATLHAIATLGIGLLWACLDRRLERTAFVIAYITGAEVLWRMTDARVFWEFGKYAIVLIAAVAMIRQRRLGGPLFPLAYFVLLLPSVALTVAGMTATDARNQISFNLSGPLALLVSSWFCSQLHLTHKQMLRMFLVLIGPIIGIAALALYSTLSAESIQFTGESNLVTSGGFGPNQVSAVLGLGALFCFWYVLDERAGKGLRLLMSVVLLILATQSALTFSRGGLYTAGGSVALAMFYLVRDTRARIKITLIGILLVVVANNVVVPQLDDFTNGAFTQRFQDTNLTARDTLLETDLQIWREHPVLGVGPGGARIYHAQAYFGNAFSDGETVAAHTEFARLLAEHGTFGLFALVLITIMGWKNLIRQQNARNKALAISLITWSLLFMFESGMRVVAPSVMFGLSFANFEAKEQQ